MSWPYQYNIATSNLVTCYQKNKDETSRNAFHWMTSEFWQQWVCQGNLIALESSNFLGRTSMPDFGMEFSEYNIAYLSF